MWGRIHKVWILMAVLNYLHSQNLQPISKNFQIIGARHIPWSKIYLSA